MTQSKGESVNTCSRCCADVGKALGHVEQLVVLEAVGGQLLGHLVEFNDTERRLDGQALDFLKQVVGLPLVLEDSAD